MSRILIIDDSELVSGLLKEALTEAGYQAAIALDANQGYATALEFHPDLILLDVQLPDVQGFDLIRVIKNREELKHTPIIMITGTHHHTDHKVKAFKAGADDYVLKPFEMPELVERIAAVLRRTQKPAAENMTPPVDAGGHTSPSANVETGEGPLPLTLLETILCILSCPETLPEATLPPVTLLSLSAVLGLSLGGWALSAGSAVKPTLIAIGTAGLWGLCVSFLVMSCSILGISMSWRKGGTLFSLASFPLILKLLGGFAVALATSLTPFYFTASPALFMKSSSLLLERLDLFELWTVWLIWVMVKPCRGSSRQKAWVAAGVVWPVLACWQSLWKH